MSYIPHHRPSGGFRHSQQGIAPTTDLKSVIEHDYQEAIEHMKDIPEELRRTLRSHDRIPKFLDNLYEGIKTWQARYPKRRPDRIKVKKIVYDMTAVFASNLKRLHDEAYMSELAKSAERKKAQDAADLAATADGAPAGDYEEVGENVVQLDTRDKEHHGEDTNAKAPRVDG